MGLRIKTNIASLQAQRNLGLTTGAQNESMQKLSSGYRINKSADDAAGLAISETLRGKVRSLQQAQRNANDGISFMQVAEGSMNEISNILIRMRELSTQAASDTIGNVERAYTNREYTQLVDEIDRITATTEFNGMKLLQGPDANNGIEALTIHVGAGDGSVPNTDTIEFPIDNIQLSATEHLGLGNQEEIGPSIPGGDFARETAAEKLTVIDTALQTVASTRATLGAKQSRLSSTVNNLGIQIENLGAANSRIRDVDYAAETANFTQQRIMANAGVSVLSQANNLPEVVMQLLR